jgi:hypothetical protein
MSGHKLYVEVKSIKNENDDLVFTNNEILAAQQLGEEYSVAIIRIKQDSVEVDFINSFYLNYSQYLERQCRQWVNILREYQFQPEVFYYNEL